MSRWQGNKVTRWQDNKVTRWQGDKVIRWQGDKVKCCPGQRLGPMLTKRYLGLATIFLGWNLKIKSSECI